MFSDIDFMNMNNGFFDSSGMDFIYIDSGDMFNPNDPSYRPYGTHRQPI